MSRLCVFLLLPLVSDQVFSIQFHLPVNSVKCLREYVDKNVLVTGEYELSEEPETATGLQITDSSGYILYHKQSATKGKFSFTTENQDKFDVCFSSRSAMGSGRVPDQLVKLDMKHGVEAKNYQEIEKLERLTPLEAKIKQIEHLSQSVADGFVYLKKRGTEMRYTNASTNARVVFLSIFSMGCLSAVAVWQVFYLRRFFKSRKLIE